MDKYTDKELDEALAILNTNGVLTAIDYPDENEKIRLDGIFRHLAARGLVKLHEAGYIAAVLLLPKGLAFINDGGFKKQEKDRLEEDTKNQLQELKLVLSINELRYNRTLRKWKAIALGLTIASYFIGYFKLIG